MGLDQLVRRRQRQFTLGLHIPAWRHIHDIFVQEGATNVSWIWSPNRDGSTAAAAYAFNTYYPGDNYVDFVGLSGYNWGTLFNTPSWISKWESFTEVFQYSYDVFAARTSKPLVISETAAPDAGGDKAAWIRDAFQTLPVRFPRFESLTWFNYVKETDWRLEGSAASLAAFRTAIAPLDTGPPNIYFDNLANGAAIHGNQSISVNATDDNAVSRVDFYLGDTWLGSSREAPFNLNLDSWAFSDGRYSLTAVAFDYAGKQASSYIDVVINNSNSRNYYFNWYDSVSPGMRCFLIIGNPGTANAHAEVFIGNQLAGSYDLPAGGRVTLVYDGRIGGPVKVVSTSGVKLLVSERSVYNGSFTETTAATAADLTQDHFMSAGTTKAAPAYGRGSWLPTSAAPLPRWT
ncbi:MAG: Ig-like domain-containing protein [Thermoleophilia bacterium]